MRRRCTATFPSCCGERAAGGRHEHTTRAPKARIESRRPEHTTTTNSEGTGRTVLGLEAMVMGLDGFCDYGLELRF